MFSNQSYPEWSYQNMVRRAFYPLSIGYAKNKNNPLIVAGSQITKTVSREMPQSGVNSTVLWLIIMNNTTKKPDRGKMKVIAYANDVVILVSEMFPTILSKTLERALQELTLQLTECELLMLFTANRKKSYSHHLQQNG